MSEPTAVIFDLDDTLYPERRFALSSYAAVARWLSVETGQPAATFFRSMVREYRGGRRATLLQQLVGESGLPVAMVDEAVAVIRSHAPRLRLPAASRAVLSDLRRAGHRLGILTNGLPDTQRAKVRSLQLDPLVDVVMYAQEYAPLGKPAAACFSAVLGALGVAPHHAVFVGDHPDKDVAGARAAGMSTIWVCRGAWRADADATVRSVHSIPALVTRLLEPRHVGVQ